MKQQLESIQKQAMEKLAQASDLKELEELKVAYLGKKGELTQILKGMGTLSPQERPIIGQLANEIRGSLEEGILSAKNRLTRELRNERLKAEV